MIATPITDDLCSQYHEIRYHPCVPRLNKPTEQFGNVILFLLRVYLCARIEEEEPDASPNESGRPITHEGTSLLSAWGTHSISPL
jgi:hypothetical protein